MTLGEIAQVASIIGGVSGLSLGLYAAISASRLRKQGSVEQMLKRVDALERRMDVHDIRLAPLFQVMNDRVISLFHQPHPGAEEDDTLIEKFNADRTDLKWSMREHELHRLFELISRQRRRDAHQPSTGDPFRQMWTDFAHASVEGIYKARVALREQEEQDRWQREELHRYLREASQADAQRESWWARLLRFLRGFNWP